MRLPGSEKPKRLTDYKTPMGETLRQPRVWLSALLFFLYVGAEVSFGIWTYSLLVELRGFSPAVAGLWAGSYWATFTIGRVVAGLYAKRVGVNVLVVGGLAGALLGGALLIWNPSPAANLLAVAMVGFAIAPIFPAFISGTSQRVGAHFAANTIGMQMAASGIGTAVIPSLVGVLARRFSLEAIPITLEMVFAVLLGFVFAGSQGWTERLQPILKSRGTRHRSPIRFSERYLARTSAGYGNFNTGTRYAAGGGRNHIEESRAGWTPVARCVTPAHIQDMTALPQTAAALRGRELLQPIG